MERKRNERSLGYLYTYTQNGNMKNMFLYLFHISANESIDLQNGFWRCKMPNT